MSVLDDDDIGAMVGLLARPRPASTGDVGDIVTLKDDRRRRRRAVASAVVVLIALGTVAGLRPWSTPRHAVPGRESSAVTFTARSSPWGFSVETKIGFPEDRALYSGWFALPGSSAAADFYVNDGKDSDRRPRPLHLRRGITVTAGARLQPDCASRTRLPTLVLGYQTGGGGIGKARFSVSNPDAYRRTLDRWCRKGPQVTVASYAWDPTTGSADVSLLIVNPRTTAVAMTSGPGDGVHGHWIPQSELIPARGLSSYVLRGLGVQCPAGFDLAKAVGLASDGTPLRLANPQDTSSAC